MTTLPLIYPSVTGVPGVIGVDPLVLQCGACGLVVDAATCGLKPGLHSDGAVLTATGLICCQYCDGGTLRRCRDCHTCGRNRL
ncbi:hypothetical protein [uncultured Arsenicicoccus sp.]|uniref:hypothetical protein n=1 Tax=uncultured Arsenicicoccus sp. TaxID=491339 RepID=UPI0025993AF9|nr:hypothetical protein [uncultured Arsenicicoccus sp.]